MVNGVYKATYITGRPHLVCRYYTRMARLRVFPMTRLYPGLQKWPRLSLALGDSQTGEKTYHSRFISFYHSVLNMTRFKTPASNILATFGCQISTIQSSPNEVVWKKVQDTALEKSFKPFENRHQLAGMGWTIFKSPTGWWLVVSTPLKNMRFVK